MRRWTGKKIGQLKAPDDVIWDAMAYVGFEERLRTLSTEKIEKISPALPLHSMHVHGLRMLVQTQGALFQQHDDILTCTGSRCKQVLQQPK